MLAVRARAAGRGRERVAQRPVGAVELRRCGSALRAFRRDRDRRHQIVSAKRGSVRRKYQSPSTKNTIVAATLTSGLPELGRAGVQDTPLEPVDDGGHRIEREEPLPLLAAAR